MSKELIEKVARDIYEFWGPYPEGCEWDGARIAKTTMDNTRATARAAILAVLDHFSEPHNITVAMLEECGPAYSLAAAMRAAKEGLS